MGRPIRARPFVHAVVREKSATPKTRVVFNASLGTNRSSSLNDTLDPGPSLLLSLVRLVVQFQRIACRGARRYSEGVFHD